jgi:glycosyltransferase involved in cell wall biosynthesis
MNSKSILFISKGESAPSTRYRALAYFHLLKANGWQPFHIAARGDPLSRLKLLRSACRSDVVVILRKTFSVPFLRLLRSCCKRLVFDLDDAVFLRSNGKPSRTRHNRFARVARHCNQIWVGNEYLADIARDSGGSVITLPTSVDPEKYAIDAEKRTDRLVLVWIGGSSTRKYLEWALPCLEQLADSLPGLNLKIVADFQLFSHHLQIDAVPWSEETESEALTSAHIGIAPMPANPWTQGKCGLKILQYMAAGLPVVASSAGVNDEIVQQGVTGFLADSPDAWRSAVNELAHDPDLPRSMGEAGRKLVEERYSVKVTWRRMARALDRLLEEHQ